MSESKTTPRSGQIWQEADPRFERFIIITPDVNYMPTDGKVEVRRVIKTGKLWGYAPRSRFTLASLSRFNGKRGGYRYVEG